MWGQVDHTHVWCATDTAWLRLTDHMQNITAWSIITASNGEHPWQGGDVEEEVRPLETMDCEWRIDLCKMLFVGDPFVSPSAVILYLSPPLSKRHLPIADLMGNPGSQKTRMGAYKSVWGSQCWRVRNYATLLSSLPSWVSRTPGKLYIRILAHQSESTTDFPPQWSHTSISHLAMPVASFLPPKVIGRTLIMS